MGYRSDVTGIIKFKTHEDRDKFVLMVQARDDGLYKNCFNNEDGDEEYNWDYNYKDEPIMTFQITNIKWYESYPEVQVNYDLCNYAVETFEAQWRIVQIGEDGATEEEGNDDDELEDYVSVVHHIETHFGQ
jgi:hypothetical protein